MPMRLLNYFAAACVLAFPTTVLGQTFNLVQQSLDNPDNEPAPVHPVPHPRQVAWQETEFYAFFHYGMNTYTGLEWGKGDENVKGFKPTGKPNPQQWLEAVKAAGMKGGIAVVKHHDGFCLWPTETTTHNATKAGNPFTAELNIPKDFAAAAKELKMKYGFYISPWDRNSIHYGTDRYVPEVFLRQCAELAQYGNDQFEMWFDGANGGDGYYGGKGGTVNVGDANIYYDVPNLRDTVHKVQNNCVLWGVGGEARWIGNEAGWAGETNWCMGDGTDGDINGWFWHPGESDAKATNSGWFYHDGESPYSAERLFQMYLETVGRNATLILNAPPNKAGVLPPRTVQVLKELGTMIGKRLSNDLAKTAKIEASEIRTPGAQRTYGVNNLTDGNSTTYWATNDGTKHATLTFTWDSAQTLRYVSLMELVAKGQRVKKFKLEVSQDGINFRPVAENVKQTTIGYKRIIPLNGSTQNSYSGQGIQAKALRVTIEDAKACPLLKSVAIY